MVSRPPISSPSVTAAEEASSAATPAARLVIQKKCSPRATANVLMTGRSSLSACAWSLASSSVVVAVGGRAVAGARAACVDAVVVVSAVGPHRAVEGDHAPGEREGGERAGDDAPAQVGGPARPRGEPLAGERRAVGGRR